MYRKKTISIGLFLLIGALILAACTPKTPAQPTPDAAAIMTQAVQTVQFQLTETAKAMPSATPTNTLIPTNTPEPPTATLAVSPTLSTTLLVPSATSPAASVPDKMLYVSQNPADNTYFTPGQSFVMTWTVKNTGTSTWTTSYQLRFYAGNRMGAADIKLPKEVKPNETIDISINMTAPLVAGDFNSTWVLSTMDGYNFGGMYVTIKVAGATATATVPVPTATIEATATTQPPTATTEATVQVTP